jgi:hypothetical protein
VLFGNGTDLSTNTTATIRPGDNLFISGKYFHPGIVYIKFDSFYVVGTVTGQEWQNAQILASTTASQTGSFQTYATIPTVSGGAHFLNIEDSQAKIIIKINVVSPNITPTPAPAPTSQPTVNPTSNPTSNPTPKPTLPSPTLNLSCRSTASASGSKVEISGSLLLNDSRIADSPVLIAYSVTGGDTWNSLTLVNTLSDGRFLAVWQPEVTGNYLIKATSEATSTMNKVSKVVNLALTPENPQDPGKNVFTLTSNSTITQFAFDPDNKELSFIASGPTGTEGYVNIYIPKTILGDISTLKAYVDGNQVSFKSESQTDSWLISFVYSHSTHTITMSITEPATTSKTGTTLETTYYIIAAAVIATMLVAVLVLKRRPKNDLKL